MARSLRIKTSGVSYPVERQSGLRTLVLMHSGGLSGDGREDVDVPVLSRNKIRRTV